MLTQKDYTQRKATENRTFERGRSNAVKLHREKGPQGNTLGMRISELTLTHRGYSHPLLKAQR